MADVFTEEKRKQIMSHIKGKDTTPEVKVRKWLYAHGVRYRKNWSKLPGKPDIAVTKLKTVIFVHGCYWHGHEGCKGFSIPKTRTEWWLEKITATKLRDQRKAEELQKLGWRVLILWECQTEKNFEENMQLLLCELKNNK